MSKLLLLEDDISLVEGLQYAFAKNGYAVDVARTVGEARALLTQGAYDLLLLDVTLPDGTGFSVCEWVRARGSDVPIVFLTAADEEVHVIRGLDSGGDDYITKPFRMGELFSRIRALLRRAGQARHGDRREIVCGDIAVDLVKNRAFLQGSPLELTLSEYKLLCLLLRNAGCVLTRKSILAALWDYDGNFVDDNTLSVNIRRLREKVEDDPSHPLHLQTVRGFGYRWNEGERNG